MADSSFKISVGGSALAATELGRIVEVQLEEAAQEADAAVLTAALDPDSGGEWRSPLDDLATPDTALVVELLRDGDTYRFEGSATEATWHVEPGGPSQLVVKAVDRTLEMAMEEKIVSWRSSDSAIAESILSSYGFRPDVKATPDKPDPDVHVVLQRATDLAFLRSLAGKWGYALYLEASTAGVAAAFKPLEPTAEPKTDLSLGFGGAARSVSVHARLLAGREVKVARIAPLATTTTKADDTGKADAQGNRSFGGRTIGLLSPNELDGEIDPTEAAKALARRSAFALTLDVELEPARVDALIRARRTVSVGGLGRPLSGTYLVDRVRHRVRPELHVQTVTLVRNAFGGTAGAAFAGVGA
jgi:phage protein D